VTFSRPVKNVRARIETFPYGVMVNGVPLNTFRNWPVPSNWTNFEYAPSTTEIDAWIVSPITDWGWMAQISNISFELADDAGSLTLELGPTSPETHRRVLTHKYRTDDTYPSPYQRADGRLEIVGWVRGANGAPLAGRTVYFRVKDPPDTAPYAVAAGDARDDDNHDRGSPQVQRPGTLTASSAVSDSSGRVSTTLIATSFASGDNYIVEATLDPEMAASPSFACGSSCARTGVITAWKRVYVEVNRMAKRGALLRADVLPGRKVLRVSDVRPFPSPPFDALLIHAPSPVEAGSDFWTEKVRVVEKVAFDSSLFHLHPEPGELRLDSSGSGVTRRYSGPITTNPSSNAPPKSYLADGVVFISGNRSEDYYLIKGKLVDDAYDSAFVEHVWLTDVQAPDLEPHQRRIPYDGVIPHIPTIDGYSTRNWLTRKWSRNVTRSGIGIAAIPNHHILFTASRHQVVGSTTWYGHTAAAGGYNDTWLYLGSIPDDKEAEALVHELAHQWRVNHPFGGSSDSGGHCDVALGAAQSMARHASENCTMTSDVYGSPDTADGIVGFHYIRRPDGTLHSEYLHCRRRAEPIPQNDVPREEPQ
jgi:hypothetical protein